MLAVASLILTSLIAVAVTAPVTVPAIFFPVDDTDDFFQSNRGSSHVQLMSTRFPFFDKELKRVRVNANGHMTFTKRFKSNTPEPFPKDVQIAAPFWADANTNNYGKVYYRDSQDPAILAQAKEIVLQKYGQLCNFDPTMVFYATWYQVPNHNEDPERNTFQCGLITNGVQSFIVFNYGDINWLLSSRSQGQYPSMGYSAGLTADYFNLPGANTPAAIDVELTSNTDVTGRWLFRVDKNDDGCEGYSCTGGGLTAVNTFAGEDLSVVSEVKTEFSLWEDDPTDQCKYSLYCVTKDDFNYAGTPLYFDWCSINVGVHSADTERYSKSVLFAQDVQGNAEVGIRGQGYQGVEKIDFSGGAYDFTVDSETWTVDRVDDNLVTFTPSSCGYKFTWKPNMGATQWQFDITAAPYIDADLAGMCGSGTGTTVTCDGSAPLEQTPANNDAIAANCVKLTGNDGSGYTGGTRLAFV